MASLLWFLLFLPTLTSTAALPSEKDNPNRCSMYCFLSPNQNDRIIASSYSNISCTHYIIGFGHIKDLSQLDGPSQQDEHKPQNWNELQELKKLNPTASILLGINLADDHSRISRPSSREQLATASLKEAHARNFTGLFFRVHSPYLKNQRVPQFFEELSKHNTNGMEIVMGVSNHGLSHSLRNVLRTVPFVNSLYVVSTPNLKKLAIVDPLLPITRLSLDLTIYHMMKILASKGIPKEKLIIGLSAGLVQYTNFLLDSATQEANGTMIPLQENCGVIGKREVDGATASESFMYDEKWITWNAPTFESIGRKVRWILSNGYGGVGMQSIELDDPEGICGLEGGAFPTVRIAASNMKCKKQIKESDRFCSRFCFFNSMNQPENLDPTMCTHVVIEMLLSPFGELKMSPEGEQISRWYDSWFVCQKPKLVLSIGSELPSDGWRMVLPRQRKFLIDQIREVMAKCGATGVIISWAFQPNMFFADPGRLDDLLDDMRQELGNDTLLAITVGHKPTLDREYDRMPKLLKNVDFLILKSFNFHSPSQPFAGHHAPLQSNSEIQPNVADNIDAFARNWKEMGADRRKLVIGITAKPYAMVRHPGIELPLYKMTIAPYMSIAINQRNLDGEKVCQLINNDPSRVYFVPDLAVPYLLHGTEIYSFEDVRSIQAKMAWIAGNDVGGIAVYDAHLDNPEGACPHHPFPLLSAIAKNQMCHKCWASDEMDHCSLDRVISCRYHLNAEDQQLHMDAHKIPYTKCDEIIVEQLSINGEGTILFQDDSSQKSMEDLFDIHHPKIHSKRLIASVRCEMMANEFIGLLDNSEAMIQDILAFLTKHGFTGVQIDCDHLINIENKFDFASFLVDLQEGLVDITPSRRCLYSLNLRIPSSVIDLTEKYSIHVLNAIDSITMEDSVYTSRLNRTLLQSPLFTTDKKENSIESTVRAWETAGLKRTKIVIGIPTFGLLQDISTVHAKVGSPASNTRIVSYAEACVIVKTGKTRTVWERLAMFSITNDNKWMTTQNPDIVKFKSFYVNRERLRGVEMSLNHDDWEAKCGAGEFPLLEAAITRCQG